MENHPLTGLQFIRFYDRLLSVYGHCRLFIIITAIRCISQYHTDLVKLSFSGYETGTDLIICHNEIRIIIADHQICLLLRLERTAEFIDLHTVMRFISAVSFYLHGICGYAEQFPADFFRLFLHVCQLSALKSQIRHLLPLQIL